MRSPSRLRPRHISSAARLPSNRGFGGIPRSLSVLLLDGHAEVAVHRCGLIPLPSHPSLASHNLAHIQRLANPVRNPHLSHYSDASWPFCDCAVGAQNRTTIPKRTVVGTSQNGLFSRVALATCVLLHVRPFPLRLTPRNVRRLVGRRASLVVCSMVVFLSSVGRVVG